MPGNADEPETVTLDPEPAVITAGPVIVSSRDYSPPPVFRLAILMMMPTISATQK